MEKPTSDHKKKILKLKILSHVIEVNNIFKFTQDDYKFLLTAVLHAIFIYWIYLSFILMTISLIYYPPTVIVIAFYYAWVVFDRRTPSTTGRKLRSSWFRNHPMFVHWKNYFPCSFIKTADLSPGRNYLLATFPHGVYPMNIFFNFLCSPNNVERIFPKIDMRLIIHQHLFIIPVLREIALAAGAHASSESSIKNLLKNSTSTGLVILPGGQAEISFSTPGSIYKIKKTGRKGFIRLALETGTPLVPVFIFGVMNIFDKYYIPMPKFFKKFHVPFCIFPKGRGIFQNNFGLIPNQHPLVTVGKPIDVPKITNPPSEKIDEFHKLFFIALFNLFEEHKHSCDIAGSKAQLIMI